ncbi:hypothetical protein CALCODRAFT_307683 [Calocera cornea HHB12733]|uniref:Uncharacterized protein n=1 Tax=Calocera cornea HHB12733 TaxID=1353952 RepID=A0A165JN23_9BASI|nr:hypothetical protein CALCODRAFT_307683 [Calocera cornea HHB12733]
MSQSQSGRRLRTVRYAPRLFEISELQEEIVTHLDRRQDLINLGCTAKILLDSCMRKLWETPSFRLSPLVTMVLTFPEQVRVHLQSRENPDLHVSVDDFVRFDYYAKFVRSITLWNDEEENYIATILSRSRPGIPLFPALTELHMAASGQQMRTARAYFSPILKTVRLNYWSLPPPTDAPGMQAVKDAFLALCMTPTLTELDLMDAIYTAFEDDPALVEGFQILAAQIEDLESRSFVLLQPVFAVLSHNHHLRRILIDLTQPHDRNISLSEVIVGLRDAFYQLRSLSLICTLPEAVRVLTESRRSFEELSTEIHGSVEAGHLHDLITRIFIETPQLRCLRITSSSPLECEAEPRIRMFEALQPLLACDNLQRLQITIPFEGDQSFSDDELKTFFKAWPNLVSCILETDADGHDTLEEDTPTEYGLTLNSIISALFYCSRLNELSLPFLSCAEIPDRDDVIVRNEPFSLRLSQSHVHNLADVAAFLTSLRPRADVSTLGCAEYPAARLPRSGADWV